MSVGIRTGDSATWEEMVPITRDKPRYLEPEFVDTKPKTTFPNTENWFQKSSELTMGGFFLLFEEPAHVLSPLE
jgi:hypothetical protein